MKIKQQYLMIFLIVNSFFLSCKSKSFVPKDLEGKYEIYTYKYGGLIKTKQVFTFELLSNNFAIWKSCQQVKFSWRIDGDNLIVHPLNDSTNVDSIKTTVYKIINENKFKIEKEMYLDSKTKMDTSYLNFLFIKTSQ